MPTHREKRTAWAGWEVLIHSVRTAVAAVLSLLAARLFRLPEAYWAPITTIVITQSSLGAALVVSGQRFVGTALGAIVGAIVAILFGPNMVVLGISVFLLGLVCAVLRVDRSAYRFGGITLALVLLIPRTSPAWTIAFHRFAEVSVGIGVALQRRRNNDLCPSQKRICQATGAALTAAAQTLPRCGF